MVSYWLIIRGSYYTTLEVLLIIRGNLVLKFEDIKKMSLIRPSTTTAVSHDTMSTLRGRSCLDMVTNCRFIETPLNLVIRTPCSHIPQNNTPFLLKVDVKRGEILLMSSIVLNSFDFCEDCPDVLVRNEYKGKIQGDCLFTFAISVLCAHFCRRERERTLCLRHF